MATKYTFTVSGLNKFPVRMLAEDSCYPAYEFMATAIVGSQKQKVCHKKEHINCKCRINIIRLIHVDKENSWQPSILRWKFFGYTVEITNKERY